MGIKKRLPTPVFCSHVSLAGLSPPFCSSLCPILFSALVALTPSPGSQPSPHKPPYLPHGVISQGHFGMGLPGALLTTPGCSLDGVQGCLMTLPTGSKSLYRILEPELSLWSHRLSRSGSVIAGCDPGTATRLLCPRRCPPHQHLHLSNPKLQVSRTLDGLYVAITSGDRTPPLALCLTRECKAGGPSPPVLPGSGTTLKDSPAPSSPHSYTEAPSPGQQPSHRALGTLVGRHWSVLVCDMWSVCMLYEHVRDSLGSLRDRVSVGPQGPLWL